MITREKWQPMHVRMFSLSIHEDGSLLFPRLR